MIKYLKTRWKIGVLALLMVAVTAGILFLYDIPLEPVGYVAVFEMLLTGLGLMWDYHKYRKKQESLLYIRDCGNFSEEYLEAPENENEAIYREICRSLDEKRIEAENQRSAFGTELTDFYTLWVHQIKTPIAAMGLLLQRDDTERGRELRAELFRIEQYVELVLSYLRLGSDSTDYVIRDHDLDSILRQAARKYATLFIRGKVSLELRPTNLRVLTDEKWLQLVVEQVLSNAVKYAPGGHVKIYARDARLIIEDDGVGIAREDLPRIFERGFTGCNGRMDKRATGIGLYLCRETCRRLGHTITAESEPGRGTRVIIGLERPLLEVE